MSMKTPAVRLRSDIVWYYGMPGLVTAIPTIPVYTLLPAFYAEQVGLGLAVTGLVLFAARGLDVVTDPLIGRLADRHDGRHIPRLLLIGALIAAPALVLLLSPPAGAGPLWLLLCATTLYLGWTLVQVPYITWGARLTTDYHERTRVTAAREGGVLLGILLSGSLPAVLGLFYLPEGTRLSLLGWIAVVLGIPVFFLLLRRVPRPVEGPARRADWSGITRNLLFLRLLGAWFVNGLANGIPAVLFPLYCAHVLAVDEHTRNLLLALYFCCAVLGIPLWPLLSRRLSKHRAWVLAMSITCPAFLVATFLGPGQEAVFALICVITGIGLGADLALPPAIQADVADWDRWRYRRHRTGGLFALWSMASKLSLALAAGVVLPLLAGFGLDQSEPAPRAITALAVIYALVPCVLKLGAVAMVYGLPLTPDRHALIAARLQRRDEAGVEAKP
jgi:Na+/melibiose symporter-like transporter